MVVLAPMPFGLCTQESSGYRLISSLREGFLSSDGTCSVTHRKPPLKRWAMIVRPWRDWRMPCDPCLKST